MNSYFFYINDHRYSVPQLTVVDASDDADAIVLAKKYMADSRHYLSIDIVEGDREVAHVEL